PYEFHFSEKSRYTDKWSVRDVRLYFEREERSKKITESTPVTQRIEYMSVLSKGPTNDDKNMFSVAEFSKVVAEQTSKDKKEVATAKQKPLKADKGSIYGEVIDQAGAAITNAVVTATQEENELSFETMTGQDGAYAILNVPKGSYRIECTAPG